MKEKEDSYIQLLRMAKEDLKSKRGISLDEFKLRVIGFGLETQFNHLLQDIYNPASPMLKSDIKENYMSIDAYLKLLEYDELKHSLEESRQARKESKWAIGIAIAAIIVQIITS